MEIKVMTVARMCEMSARSIESLNYDDVFVGYEGNSFEQASKALRNYIYSGVFATESELTKEFVLKGLVYIYAREHKKRGHSE